jgi:hypothetical protein
LQALTIIAAGLGVPLGIGLVVSPLVAVAIFAGVVAVLFFSAAFRLQTQLDNLAELPKPNVQHIDVLSDKRPLTDGTEAFFVHAAFANRPTQNVSGARAERVYPHLSFYSLKGEPLLDGGEIGARWNDSPQITDPTAARPYQPMSLDVGAPKTYVGLLVKHPDEDGYCYAFNDKYPIGSRYEPYRINKREYKARLRLEGEGVDQEWWFRIHNVMGGGLEIENIAEPS